MRQVAVLALALLLPTLTGCEQSGTNPGALAAAAGSEFDRHLRLGIDQLRRYLVESARAELDKCAELDPADPELLFHEARLLLLEADANRNDPEAIALLERVVAEIPGSVKANRLLYELTARSVGAEQARRYRDVVDQAYGAIGALEARSLDGSLEQVHGILTGRISADGADDPELVELLQAYRGVLRAGNHAPSESVPRMERLLERYPDLAVLRYLYANDLLLGEVRVAYTDRPDQPLMSSELILDIVQSHLENVFDQVDPRSSLAVQSVLTLGNVAMQMADYEQVIVLADVVLAWPGLPDPLRRSTIGQKGLARLKQERHLEAVELLEAALAGSSGASPQELWLRWLVHLAYEEAGTPTEARRHPFRYRPDLALPGDETPLLYEDIAPRVGVNKLDGLGPSAWGDYDRDGDFDLYVSGGNSYGALYRNDGDVFVDVSREAGLFNTQSGFSTTFVDYDNDGWSDLFVGRDGWNGPSVNSLYRNNGDGTFSDVTEQAGFRERSDSFVHAWSDVDRDGDLDLYVACGITGTGQTNVFYRNNGDGTFTDATEEAGLQETPGTRTIGFAFGDYDLDGWPDLFVSGFGTLNRLYRNQGDGTFEEIAEAAGVNGAGHISRGYTCFFVDYDNDTDPDILRTSLADWTSVLLALSEGFETLGDEIQERLFNDAPKLYRNNGDGTFTDVSAAANLVHPIGVMGSNVADLDNDGHVDLYLGTGDPTIFRMEPDRFLRNTGDGTFVDLTFAAGLGNVGKGHGITFVDFDEDGELEIYAPEGGFVHGDPWANAFYDNTRENPNHWLQIDLEGVKSNRDGLDTRIIVRSGDTSLMRETKNGEGFGSTNSPTVEFGLGQVTKIDRVELTWSSGTVQSFTDVPLDTRIFVREGEGWTTWADRTGR